MEDVYHALLLLFLLNANLLMLTAIVAVLWRRKPRCVITWRSGMSDVTIPQESTATATAVICNFRGIPIPDAVFDEGTETSWILGDPSLCTQTIPDNEHCILTAVFVGQTWLRVTGRYQGQTITDEATVTVSSDEPETYRVSIEWNQPVPPV